MCQQMVSGVSFDTGNFIVASETATSCMKSLFYGLLETYFAVYDSVVLTGPSSSTILTLAIVSINIILLHILIPGALEMLEQWIKFRLGQPSHGKKKLRMLLDLMVRKHYPVPLEEENGSMHRVLNKRITLR